VFVHTVCFCIWNNVWISKHAPCQSVIDSYLVYNNSNIQSREYVCHPTKLKTFPQIGTRFVNFIKRQRFSLFIYCVIVRMWLVGTFSKYLLKQIRSSYFFSKYLHKSIFSSGFVLKLFGLFCWPKHEMKRDRSVWHKSWTCHGVWTQLRAGWKQLQTWGIQPIRTKFSTYETCHFFFLNWFA